MQKHTFNERQRWKLNDILVAISWRAFILFLLLQRSLVIRVDFVHKFARHACKHLSSLTLFTDDMICIQMPSQHSTMRYVHILNPTRCLSQKSINSTCNSCAVLRRSDRNRKEFRAQRSTAELPFLPHYRQRTYWRWVDQQVPGIRERPR